MKNLGLAKKIAIIQSKFLLLFISKFEALFYKKNSFFDLTPKIVTFQKKMFPYKSCAIKESVDIHVPKEDLLVQ